MKKEMMEKSNTPQTEKSIGGEVSKKEQREIDFYNTGLAKLLHSKETRNDVFEMLKSAPPEQSIPHTALQVNKLLEEKTRSKNKPPSLTVLINACLYLVSDLIEIGNAGGAFQIDSEDQVQSILKDTIEMYIKDGVKKGTVDPVEVQAAAEQYMPEEDRMMALEAGQQAGIPVEAGQQAAMESYAMNRERKAISKTEQKFKNQQQQQMQQGALAQNAPQGG